MKLHVVSVWGHFTFPLSVSEETVSSHMSSSENYRYCPLSPYTPLMRRAFDHHFKDDQNKETQGKGDLVKSTQNKWHSTAVDHLSPEVLDSESATATVQPCEW